MLDTINRHFVQPFIAARRRSRQFEYLHFLERSQFDSPEVIRDRQFRMLTAQLRHAYATVPYYRAAWLAAGVHPEDVRSFADFADFPVLTKTDIRTAGDRLLSSAFAGKKLRVKRTSGSTGVPLTIRLDERGAQWKTACTIRSDEWSGYRLGQRVAKVWGNPDYRHFGLRGRLSNWLVDRAVYLDTCHLTDARLRDFVAILRRHRPGLLFGHAHSLYLVACHLKEAGITDIRPNGVISSSMPLHDWQRAVIDEVFGVPTTNRYGCEEVSLIASQCERHTGLHVAAESIYTEIEPTGHLLVTDLSNFAMPLIRYRVGDVVTPSIAVCPCGRGLPTFDRVEGRDADYVVTPAGGRISGISLTENFALHIPNVAQVQLVQETVTFLRVRLVPEGRFTEVGRNRVAALVADTFGPTMTHEVELVAGIPQEPSGKYRFCISHVTHR